MQKWVLFDGAKTKSSAESKATKARKFHGLPVRVKKLSKVRWGQSYGLYMKITV